MDFPFPSFRSLFPAVNKQIHLASCSQSAFGYPVAQSVQAYLDSLQIKGSDWEKWTKKVEEAKERFASLIGAKPEEVALHSSLSAILSSVVTSFSLDKRKKLVTTEMDFPTVGQILLAQERAGAQISFVPSIQGEIPLELYEQTITSDTQLTCVAHVSFQNGYQQELAAIAKVAHARGSFLFVDACQSAGHVPIDVKAMDIDMLAAFAQKYLLGLNGVAFLYMKPEVAKQLRPRVTGWYGQETPFSMDLHHLQYAAGVRRFETGTPSVLNVYAAAEGMKLLLDADYSKVTLYLKELGEYIVGYAKEKGLHVAGPSEPDRRSSITAIYVEKAQEIERMMRKRGIIVSAREDVIRFAPHFYNHIGEITEAINELASTIHA